MLKSFGYYQQIAQGMLEEASYLLHQDISHAVHIAKRDIKNQSATNELPDYSLLGAFSYVVAWYSDEI